MSAHEVLLLEHVHFTDQKNTEKPLYPIIGLYISQITVALGLL